MINNLNYKTVKWFLDFIFAFILFIILFPLFIIIFILTSFSTKSVGIYVQKRIGYKNNAFYIYKFKTMIDSSNNFDYITEANDKRITNLGKILRRFKIDELPQLINIIKGEMSFVGPRPDVEKYNNLLNFDRQYLKKVKPGITSDASLYFKDEEIILSKINDKLFFNDNIIWPIKEKFNNDYADTYSLVYDIDILLKTIGLKKYKKFLHKNYNKHK